MGIWVYFVYGLNWAKITCSEWTIIDPVPPSFEPQPDRMSHRGRPVGENSNRITERGKGLWLTTVYDADSTLKRHWAAPVFCDCDFIIL